MRVSIWSNDINVVSLICRVDFGAVLLEVNDVVVRNNTSGCLVDTAPLNHDLLAQVHSLVEDSVVALPDKVLFFITEDAAIL